MLVYVIGLRAAQFGNNWIGKIPNFSNSIIPKLGSILSYYVLIILYMGIKIYFVDFMLIFIG